MTLPIPPQKFYTLASTTRVSPLGPQSSRTSGPIPMKTSPNSIISIPSTQPTLGKAPNTQQATIPDSHKKVVGPSLEQGEPNQKAPNSPNPNFDLGGRNTH